ncbi:MAG: toxin HicA [Oligoflexia bacterium]|nr:toxin HicA [Oligoflexia bacterium]
MFDNPKNVRFDELLKVCIKYFGNPRVRGSHHIFNTPWPGDPRINIQKIGNMAKPYQVRQVMRALDKLRDIEKTSEEI